MSDIRIGIRCDAGRTTGVGHLIRSIALAEELQSRGIDVIFLGDTDGLAWAQRQLDSRGLPLLPGPTTPAAMVTAVRELALDALVVDSYTLAAECAGAVRDQGVPVLAIVDGDLRDQDADLFLDQNLDAEFAEVKVPEGSRRLAGLDYALLRDAVRRLRPIEPRGRQTRTGPPHVLAFFGGTDAFGAAPVLTRLLLATGQPLELTVVAGSDNMYDELMALPTQGDQGLEVVRPTDRLPELIAEADLVITASGTSTWEVLCLGTPAALVWVVDNQWLGYERVMARGLATGLGRLSELVELDAPAATAAIASLHELLSSTDARVAASARAFGAVDGRGRERVADELLALITGQPGRERA